MEIRSKRARLALAAGTTLSLACVGVSYAVPVTPVLIESTFDPNASTWDSTSVLSVPGVPSGQNGAKWNFTTTSGNALPAAPTIDGMGNVAFYGQIALDTNTDAYATQPS